MPESGRADGRTAAGAASLPPVLPLDAADREAKAEARRRWETDRVAMLVQEPFVGQLAMRLALVPVVDDRLRTACTDGCSVFGNAHWLLALDEHGRRFVLRHEVFHCALRHLLRGRGREADLWNVAADHEVNALIGESGTSIPAGAVWYPQFHGWNAERVYADLSRRLARAEAEGRELAPNAWEPGDTSPEPWDCQKPGPLWPGQTGVKDRGPNADQHAAVGDGPDPWALPMPSGKFDPDYGPAWDEETLDRWREHAVQAAQQARRQRGELPGGAAWLVEPLTKPRLPWRELLARFVSRTWGGERSWLPPSRRHAWHGLYLPSRRQWTVRLGFAVDTSGSCVDLLPLFLGELLGICGSFGDYEIRALQCDAGVRKAETFTPERSLEAGWFEARGGGGTDFRPAFEWFAREGPPEVMLYLTDGHGTAPEREPPWPVLWVVPEGGVPPAGWGELLVLRLG